MASDGGADGTFLPFVDGPAPGQVRTSPPRLHVLLGGRRVTAVMDTGSTGLVIAASAIPDRDRLVSLGPARLTYSSSGRVMEGDWVLTRVTIAGRDGALVRTEPMPVLAVTRITCLRSARRCTPEEHPSRVAMLGVGYAREADHQTQGTPDHNPFLRTEAEVSGQMRRGYLVSRDGVTVGLSQAPSDRAFTLVRLERDERLGDWRAPPACLEVDRRAPPACGTVLVDTGVSESFLTVGGDQLAGVVDGTAVREGTRVEVRIGIGDVSHLTYFFRVADPGDAVAPSKVTVVRRSGPAFLNTGVRFLNSFDVLYDADRGLAGFRARQQ